MKFLIKVWDMFLFVFAFSTTKHCEKMNIDRDNDFLRGGK